MIVLPELTIEELKRNNKQNSSYSYTLLLKHSIEEIEKEIYIDTLKNIFDNIKVLTIKDTLKKSLKNFLEKNSIKYNKSASTIDLIDKVIKYNQNNDIKLVVTFENFSPTIKEQKYIEHLLRNLFNGTNYNYPILITTLRLYEMLNKDNSLWRYKPVNFFKADIPVEVAIWINEYECYKCKSNIPVVGAVLKYKDKNRIIQLNELNVNFIEFIQKYFSIQNNDKKIEIHIDYVDSKKEICNFCIKCNALIGNYYIFDDFIVESMPFWDEPQLYEKFEYLQIPYEEVKKCFNNKELSWIF